MSLVIHLAVGFFLGVCCMALMFLANGYEEAHAKGFIPAKDFRD